MTSPFVGSWSYRSFQNNPDLAVPFDALRFGVGTLALTEPTFGQVSGTLGVPAGVWRSPATTPTAIPITLGFKAAEISTAKLGSMTMSATSCRHGRMGSIRHRRSSGR